MKIKHTATGEDLYFVQRELLPGTQHVDRATATLVAFDPDDWDDYGQDLTEGPDYFYGATHLTISNGPYIYDIYKRLGAEREITDTLIESIQGYWAGGTLHTQVPFSPAGFYQVDIQSVKETAINSINDFKAPAPPTFQILPSIQHGSTGVILRVPIMRKDGEPSGGGLTFESMGLFIAIRPNNEDTPTYVYAAGDSEIENIATIGTYQAPTAGHIRFAFASPAGMYEIHLENDILSHLNATNLTIMVSGPDHATTLCEVPLMDPPVAPMPSFNFHILPEILHGSVGNILRLPVEGPSLTHETAGLTVTVRPNNSNLPTYEYAVVSDEVENVTTPGTYQAPSVGKVRFAAAPPVGMYELHFENDIYNHLNATNLTIMIDAPDCVPTICEVPLVQHTAATLANQINLLPEASTMRAFADPVFDYDLTTGVYISGTIADTQSTLDPDLVFSPADEAILTVEIQFICTDGVADTLEITGRTTGSGGTVASREVSVWAYNIATTEWGELSTGGTRIPVSDSNVTRDYVLQPQHQNQDTGVVRIQFRSQRANAADRFYLDRSNITVLRAGISVSQIVQGVHYTKIEPTIMQNTEHNLPAWFWWQIRPLIFNIASIDGDDITCSGDRFDSDADYVGHTLQFHLGGAGTYRFARVIAQAGAVLTVDDAQDVDDTWHGYILTSRIPSVEIGEISGLTAAQAQTLKDILALVT